jgi:hypothetical protein
MKPHRVSLWSKQVGTFEYRNLGSHAVISQIARCPEILSGFSRRVSDPEKSCSEADVEVGLFQEK